MTPYGQVTRLPSGECIDALGRRCVKAPAGGIVVWTVHEPITYPAFTDADLHPIGSHSTEGVSVGEAPPQGQAQQRNVPVTSVPSQQVPDATRFPMADEP